MGEREGETDREATCTGERCESQRERRSSREWRSESKPVGEATLAEFQVVLMALLTP